MAVAQIGRDVTLSLRSGGGWFHAIFFFSVFSGFCAFAIGPETSKLAAAGPALIWLGATLALQLSMIDLFRPDFNDGTLRALVAEQPSLLVYVVAKIIAMFLTSGAPILVLSPVFFLVFGLEPGQALLASAVLVTGLPVITLASAVAAGLSAGMRTGGLLGTGLAAPILIPVLIFGIEATERTLETGQYLSPELMILFALALFYSVVLPPFTILSLRSGLE